MLFATLYWFDVLYKGVYIHNIEYYINGLGIWARIQPYANEIIARDNSIIDNNALGRSYYNELQCAKQIVLKYHILKFNQPLVAFIPMKPTPTQIYNNMIKFILQA